MEFSIYKPEDFKTSTWSGGTTTQLFIYPSSADYLKRNFDFRISTAKVTVAKSDFTSLPGISRKIVVLEGEIVISHEKHYSKHLKKFDIDEFEGDWKTSAIGTCTDFNVMTKNQLKSEVSALILVENESVNFNVSVNCNYFLVYIYSGSIDLKIENESHTIYSGNMLVVSNISTQSICLSGLEKSELVLTQIGSF